VADVGEEETLVDSDVGGVLVGGEVGGALIGVPLLRHMDIESRLEWGGVNRAKLKFTKLITTTSRVSVRNNNESERGRKTNRKQMKSVTRGFVLPRFGSRKPTPC
jgi:hypothetical protein